VSSGDAVALPGDRIDFQFSVIGQGRNTNDCVCWSRCIDALQPTLYCFDGSIAEWSV
jgi:hypothetical protein